MWYQSAGPYASARTVLCTSSPATQCPRRRSRRRNGLQTTFAIETVIFRHSLSTATRGHTRWSPYRTHEERTLWGNAVLIFKALKYIDTGHAIDATKLVHTYITATKSFKRLCCFYKCSRCRTTCVCGHVTFVVSGVQSECSLRTSLDKKSSGEQMLAVADAKIPAGLGVHTFSKRDGCIAVEFSCPSLPLFRFLTCLIIMENKTPPIVMQTMKDEKIRPVGRFWSGTTPCKVGTHINTTVSGKRESSGCRDEDRRAGSR